MTRGANFTSSAGVMALGTVRAGWPVAAQTLRAAGQTANWLLARGTPLVVDGGHYWGASGGGSTTRTLNYRCEVDSVHPGLALCLVVSATFQFPVTILGTEYIVGERPNALHIPVLNLTGDGEISLAFTFAWDAPYYLAVHSLHMYECPNAYLPSHGVDEIVPHTVVYDGYDDRVSIAGLARAVEEARTYFRRGTVFNWATGLADGFNTDETSFQDYYGSVAPAIQNRLMYAFESTRNCKVNVFARVDSGSTGEVKIAITNGVATFDVTFTITSTTNTWHTTQTIAVATDQPDRWDTDGGLRDGRADLQISARVTGASQRVYVLAVSIWDPPG